MIKHENIRKKQLNWQNARLFLYLRVFPSHLIMANNTEQHIKKPA